MSMATKNKSATNMQDVVVSNDATIHNGFIVVNVVVYSGSGLNVSLSM